MSTRTRFPIAFAALLAVAGCGGSIVESDKPSYGPAPAKYPVAGVTMKYTSADLVVGDTLQLQATPRTASGAATGATYINWRSTAPAIADVSPNALVTAISPGTAYIIVSADGYEAQTIINVRAVQAP